MAWHSCWLNKRGSTKPFPYFEPRQNAVPRADFLNNLGEAERRSGQLPASIATFQQAIRLAPQFAEAHYNLGCALNGLDDVEGAVQAFRRAIALRSVYPGAHFNLGNMLRKEGKLPVAADEYRLACRQQPGWWEPAFNLAVTQLELGETEPALERLQQMRDAVPASMKIEIVLGDAYAKQGLIHEARTWYSAAQQSGHGDAWDRCRTGLLTEVIPSSTAAIDETRAAACALIQTLQNEPLKFDAEELHRQGLPPLMAWAYHGRDDRALRTAYADVFLNSIQPVERPLQRPRANRPHVGFVVTHGHEGVFDRCLGALVAELARRSRLQVSWVSTRAGLNTLRHLRADFSGGVFMLPESIPAAAQALAASNLDMLYYWEIGTDATNYFLPFYRPVESQWAGWGWPVTTGHTRITGFLSSSLLEPEAGELHYVEPLIRLPVLPTFYERPPVPLAPLDRDQLLSSINGPLLLCLQNLRKLTPEFDQLLGKVLRANPSAQLAFISDEQPGITQLLRQRLELAMPDLMSRVHVLPRLDRTRYLGCVASADLILDPVGYGAGANTALDAAAAGTPVVTWRGQFHRGRWQAAVNQQLGVSELTVDSAADYVRIATTVLQDEELIHDLRVRIGKTAPTLFENEAAVTAHEQFFLSYSS